MIDPRSQPENPKPRRRVSHRKEFAVVTLAMVASVAGAGGLLAAHQPGIARAADVTHRTTVLAPARPDGAAHKPVEFAPASWRDDGGGDDGEGYAAVRHARVKHTRNKVPSFSARSQAPASAVSQGSPPVG